MSADTKRCVEERRSDCSNPANGGDVAVGCFSFDSSGNVLGVFDGNGGSLPSSGLGLCYLFQGREYSWATHVAWDGVGLYYFRARYYDPSAGRWLSNDPIGISGGLNQYVFCANNPVNVTDPSGKLWVQLSGTLIGAAANYSRNYNAFIHDKISGWEYTKSVLFGAGVGFLSTVVPGATGILVGGGLAGVNDAYNQSVTSDSGIDLNHSAQVAMIGVGTGMIGFAVQAAFENAGFIIIYDSTGGIGEVAGTAPYNFSDLGGAFGFSSATILCDTWISVVFSRTYPPKCP